MFTLQDNGDYAFTDAQRNVWGTIDVNVTLASTGEVIPFTVDPQDTEEHGRALWDQINARYLHLVAPLSDTQRDTELAEMARQDRNRRLNSTDWTQTPDVPEATRSAWTAYRQALRDVPTQSGFPADITWPTPPS